MLPGYDVVVAHYTILRGMEKEGLDRAFVTQEKGPTACSIGSNLKAPMLSNYRIDQANFFQVILFVVLLIREDFLLDKSIFSDKIR